ncbi:hypothetical protein GCM10027048_34000 [Hymenobacter coalescens]
MRYSYRLLLPLLLYPLLSARAQSVAPTDTARLLTIHPAVGPVIDGREKAAYGLFPYYSADNFQEARFYRALRPDSALTLHTLLRDGRTALRPFSPPELEAVRGRITEAVGGARPTSPADSVGRTYRVTLRSGTSFVGVLRARRPQELEFDTPDLGRVVTPLATITAMEVVDTARRPRWEYVGNGHRLFFAPTARNLRRGEGYVQDIWIFLVGANYGVTDNFSVGVLASAIPGLPLHNQALSITPKLSFPVTPRLSVGAGALYARIPGAGSYDRALGAGVVYGLTTYGSANHNLTLGLGYGLTGTDGFGQAPVVMIGGTTRVSRRVSLASENYLLSNVGFGGLYGVRLHWPRVTFNIASGYLAPVDSEVLFGYLYPLYLDVSLRFGRIKSAAK